MDKNINVLIVDDEERFRQTTASILERRGFSVKAVGSGIEAIEEVKNNDLDVVVLDVKMPGMDGHEALKEIKKLSPDLSVIMLTGHGTPESALQGLSDGVFDYLQKPCSVDVLARKIYEASRSADSVMEAEPKVTDIMVPLSSFSTIKDNSSVGEAIKIILRSFTMTMNTSTVCETVHRSILVLDSKSKNNKVTGIITFTDMLEGLQPPYMRLLSQRPAMADNIYLRSPGYSGMFTIMARDLVSKTVRDLMSDAPPVINRDESLMEAANRMLNLGLHRLLVVDGDNVIGVAREQDLFFEMARIMEKEATG